MERPAIHGRQKARPVSVLWNWAFIGEGRWACRLFPTRFVLAECEAFAFPLPTVLEASLAVLERLLRRFEFQPDLVECGVEFALVLVPNAHFGRHNGMGTFRKPAKNLEVGIGIVRLEIGAPLCERAPFLLEKTQQLDALKFLAALCGKI